MAGVNNDYLQEHKRFRIKNKKLLLIFPLLAVIIAILVFWWLKIVGITITSEAFCGVEEHAHTEECYSSEYVCGYEEKQEVASSTELTEADTHKETEEAEKKAEEATEKESEEAVSSQEHVHSDKCIKRALICEKPEHTHTAECFPDKTIDTETVGQWLSTIEDVELTNDIPNNLVAVAMTQAGYEESEKNFEYDSDGNRNAYTRYGEWYGNPYMKWNPLFVSFCINYSNINNSDPLECGTAESMRQAWQERRLYSSAKKYTAKKGDIVFYDLDSDGKADRVGIVIHNNDDAIIVVEGDVDGAVDTVTYNKKTDIMGYGRSGELYAANHITEAEAEKENEADKESIPDSDTESENEVIVEGSELIGVVNHYISNEDITPKEDKDNDKAELIMPGVQLNVFNSEPLTLFAATRSNITYTSHLEDELVYAVLKDLSGTEITDGQTVYIGQSYVVSLEFSEINTGSSWVQFEHNEDGFLTYHIPENLHCEAFTSWHSISATTENGTIEDVGEYFVDENGLLKVRFFDDANGVNFVEKYANVDFTIDFTATVASTQSGESTEVVFNDQIKVDLNIDGGAAMNVTKTHGTFDNETHTMDYTIKVEATKGVVKDLVIDDQIWENHQALRDTIVVTDLEGNVLDPQPVISDHPSHNQGAAGGFSLSGFPDFSAGNGFLITYKSQIYDYLLANDSVSMWNGLDSTGKDSNGNPVYVWTDDWINVELEKIEKKGNQAVLEDAQGNPISVIEWEVVILKSNSDLQGTVIIDTLGDGLAYYTDKDILVKRYDQWGNPLPDAHISWDNVTITGNSMSFALPEGFSLDIVYYTTFEALDDHETKSYTNSIKATIDGKEESTSGSADVVGFIPRVQKSAAGNDGENVYFTIEADVPSVIKDWGNFYLTDLSAFWGYDNDVGYLYVENIPENVEITAVTASGQTITFTPYVEGGPIENTFMVVAPSLDNQYHSFNILFNTADATLESSKWIIGEDAKLTITYKLPFDAKTGTEWLGELSGDLTLEDVLLSGKTLSNEVYLNYTKNITTTGSASYSYAPTITKKGIINDDGTIDYTVVFHNTIPGSGGEQGYLSGANNIHFTDTFDEKMEYVEGSLKVTCYDPWRTSLWLNEYQYNGTVQGNSIDALATDFDFSDYNYAEAQFNPDGSVLWGTWLTSLSTYQEYCNNMSGGDHIFTYTLRLKDEYLYTTEHNMFELENTAELKWNQDETSGPATEKSEYETGLIDKHAVQKDSKLEFDIHINRRALDILENSDTLTIEDTMTENLSVYWDSIKLLYQDENGNWIDFNSQDSRYTYTVTYDPPSNKLTFIVPDSLHIRIDYTTLITESGMVSVNNAVKVDGKAEVSDVLDAVFKVEEHSGGASGSVHNIMLLKQDGTTDAPLEGAEFVLYGPMGDPDAVIPSGVPQSIVTKDGNTLRYIGTYITGDHGTVVIETQYLTLGGPYALVEKTAPEGYQLLPEPELFYFYEPDPDGIIHTVTTLIAIENFNGDFVLPSIGGIGTFPFTIIGIALTAFPILYSIIRRKRERRFA